MTAPAAAAPASSGAAAQAAQAGLVVALAGDLQRAFGTLDVASLRASLPRFTLTVAGLVHRYGAAAATLAARYYAAERVAAGVTSSFTITPAEAANLPQIGSTVRWATQPLWSTEPEIEAAQRNLVAGVEKLVLDTGRDTIIRNVHRDPAATGWARITEPQPCAFCALLAIRGAVYKSDKTADFRAHDHCRCHAQPTFGPYEPSAQVREWQRLYQDSTTGGNAARTRREWRQAFDAAQQ